MFCRVGLGSDVTFCGIEAGSKVGMAFSACLLKLEDPVLDVVACGAGVDS